MFIIKRRGSAPPDNETWNTRNVSRILGVSRMGSGTGPSARSRIILVR